MKILITSFLRGCLVVVPIVVTVYAVYFVVRTVDGLVGLDMPGLGFAITVALITLIGALASNVIGKRLLALPDLILARLPLVKLIYTSLRDFMAALVGDRRSFDRPVMITLESDIKILGFVTRDDLAQLGLVDHVGVYLPQSINFAGQLLLVPRARVQVLPLPAHTILPVIVSGGMAGRE